MKKRPFRKIIKIIILSLLALLRCGYFFELYASSTGVLSEKWKLLGSDVVIETIQYNDQPVRYADLGNKNGPMLILVHGSPGSMTTWSSLIETSGLINDYRIIAIDRPGYAGSYNGYSVPSIAEQASLISGILDFNTHGTLPVIIGHSLGAPIALRLAADYPEKVGGVVSIAGAVDPGSQRIRWISHLLHLPVLRYLSPPGLRVTNAEKLVHVKELKQLGNVLQNITAPVVIMHGDADWIVPVESAGYTRDKVIHSDVTWLVRPERDHFLPFDKVGEVEQAIRSLQ